MQDMRSIIGSKQRQPAVIQASQPLQVCKLNDAERVVASHMAALGLLMPEEVDGDLLLCPTFLASLLCGLPGAISTTASSIGYIVVETSFRLYAYTSSIVQVCFQSFNVEDQRLAIFCLLVVLAPCVGMQLSSRACFVW
jgi:hypothetical protein